MRAMALHSCLDVDRIVRAVDPEDPLLIADQHSKWYLSYFVETKQLSQYSQSQQPSAVCNASGYASIEQAHT